jgi:hypothetical protein
MAFKPRPLFTVKTKILENSPQNLEKGENWKKFEIGSIDWMRFWREHPESQDEMLEFKKDKQNG